MFETSIADIVRYGRLAFKYPREKKQLLTEQNYFNSFYRTLIIYNGSTFLVFDT